MNQTDYGSIYAARQLARSHNPLRKLVKGFYLRNLVRDVIGPTIDFGCGAGQLLKRLPTGSIGLETNNHLVSALSNQGQNVHIYDPEYDQLCFKNLQEGHFDTLVMSHVLEHFDNAGDGLKRILDSCNRLAIKRVIIVVPGRKGYSFDDTHRTFVDRVYIEESELTLYGGYAVSSFAYFPLNISKIGNHFSFHELKIIYDAV